MSNGNDYLEYDDELDTNLQDLASEVEETNTLQVEAYNLIQRRMEALNLLYIESGYLPIIPAFIFNAGRKHNEDVPIVDQLPGFNALYPDTLYILNDDIFQRFGTPELTEFQNRVNERNLEIIQRMIQQQNRPPPPPTGLAINPYEVHQEASIISRNPLWNKIKNIIYKDGIQSGHYIFLMLDPRPFPTSGLNRENIKQVLFKFVELTNRRPEYKRNRITELQNIFSAFSIQLGPDDLNLIRVVFDYMFYLDIPELYAKYISKLTRTCLQAYATNQGNEMNENRNGRFQEMGMSCVNGRLERLYTVALEVLTLLSDDQLLTSSPPKKSVNKIKELKRALDVVPNKKDALVTLVTREKIERLFQKWVTQDVPLPDNQGAEEPQEDPLVGKSVGEIKAHALNYIQREFSKDDGIDFSTDEIGLKMIEDYLGSISFQKISSHRGELLGLLGGGKKLKTKNIRKTKKRRNRRTKTPNKRKTRKSKNKLRKTRKRKNRQDKNKKP